MMKKMKQVLFGTLTGLAVLKLMFFATLLASCNSEDDPQVKTTVKLTISSPPRHRLVRQ